MTGEQAASVQAVAHHSAKPSDSSRKTGTQLSGRMLVIARVLWVAIAVLALAAFVAGIPTRFDTLSSATVGIGLSQNLAGEFVISPTRGLAAAASGVQEGDILVAVDGVALQPGMGMPSLLRILRGPPGTQVRLDVRSHEGATRQYSITRVGYPLEEYGISTDAYAFYLTILGAALVVGSCVPAWIVFLRKSDDWVALMMSLTILIIAVFNSAAYAGSAFLPAPLSVAMRFAYHMSILVVLCVFPDGRFVPRWTRVFLLVGGAWILWKILPLPFGQTLVSSSLWIVIDAAIFGTAIFAQVYRYRHGSRSQERLQTKWITYGMVVAFLAQYAYYMPLALVPAISAPTALGLGFSLVGRTFHQLAMLVLPITVTHAVLRRRLYEIDLIINRTLVYLPLSAVVVGVFTAVITLSQRLFVALTGQTSDIAIVLTTLVVAATVAPIRERIQVLVDTQFKEAAGPERKLNAFGEQVQSRIGAVDAGPITRRLLEQIVKAYDVESGVAYLMKNGEVQPVHTIGEWKGEGKVCIPVECGGERIASIELGARRSGGDYTQRDREAMGQVAEVVARAIEEDRQRS